MSVENEILDLEKKFWQSMIDRDAAAGARLAANPCIVAGAQGIGRIDRKTFVKMMEGGAWTLHDFAFREVKFEQATDDVAVIAYKIHETLTVDGRKLELEAADASTWVRRNGAWMCILHTESLIGDPYGRDRKSALESAEA